ncbi:MAG: iron-sulfur cluster assembly accessory protein [Pseudomonadota bacterium]
MLELTDSAKDAIRAAIDGAGQQVAGLRVMVQDGGCAGLKYGMALELDQQEDDAVVESDGVVVLIDPASQQHLTGTTIDYVTTLEQSGFVFNNPNANTSCGCGKSFC